MMPITSLPLQRSRISLSLSSSLAEPSKTARIRVARSILVFAISTPIASTTSSLSRIPAVSARRSTTLPTRTVSSTISLVVPAISVTIERLKPESIFIRADLPTLGLPTIAVSTPSVIALPASNFERREESPFLTVITLSLRASSLSSGISSSG